MKSMRLAQRHALRQLFEARPGFRRPAHPLRVFETCTLKTASFRRIEGQTRPIHIAQGGTRGGLPKNGWAKQAFRPKNNGRRYNSSSTSSSSGPDAPKLSISQRLKKLSREYGWSALAVYMLLTALDFPFCFLAVRMLGTDRIGHWEHVVVTWVKDMVKWPLPKGAQEQVDKATDAAESATNGEKRILEEKSDDYTIEDHGYKAAEKANSGANASTFCFLLLLVYDTDY